MIIIYYALQIICIDSTDLLSLHGIGNIRLNQTFSPYYVYQTGALTTNVYIENGVSIIFNGSYELTIIGDIDVGCFQYNTTKNNNQGLANSSSFTSISGIDEGFGTLSLRSNLAKFCNVKFENMNNSIKFISDTVTGLVIDNCVFDDINYPLWIDINIIYYVTDCYVNDIIYFNIICSGIYSNINVNSFESFFSPSTAINFVNNSYEVAVINSYILLEQMLIIFQLIKHHALMY